MKAKRKEPKEKNKAKERSERMKEKKEKIDNSVVVLNDKEATLNALCEFFNNNTTFKKVISLSRIDKQILAESLRLYGEEKLKECFIRAQSSDFLTGRKVSRFDWEASFGWMIKPHNVANILNGKYDDNYKPIIPKLNEYNSSQNAQIRNYYDSSLGSDSEIERAGFRGFDDLLN